MKITVIQHIDEPTTVKVFTVTELPPPHKNPRTYAGTIALSAIYDSLPNEKERKKFVDEITKYVPVELNISLKKGR